MSLPLPWKMSESDQLSSIGSFKQRRLERKRQRHVNVRSLECCVGACVCACVGKLG